MRRNDGTECAHSRTSRAADRPPFPSDRVAAPADDTSWLLAPTARAGLDRAAVVTGVSKGIGAAIARELASKGCHVFGSVRAACDAAPLAEELGPARFTALIFDVTDTDAVAKGVATVDEALKGRTLFALVNNAGMHAGVDPVATLPAADLRRQLEVNTVAPIAVTQAFLPLLGTDRTRVGAPGRVIMMSSIYGNYGVPWNVCVAGGGGRREGQQRGGRRHATRGPTPFSLSPPPRAPTPPPNSRWKASLNACAESSCYSASG